VITRRSVWSDPGIQQLLQQFVPAADEVGRLQRDVGPEGKLFRTVAEQGHYAGRTEPTDTRQGIYATAPSGVMLASVNTRSAGEVEAMLRRALDRWNEMPEADRYLSSDRADAAPLRRRREHDYPADGLVLRVNSRDLPRAAAVDGADRPRRRGRRGWHRAAWNQNYLWMRKSEVVSLIPRTREVGAMRRMPADLAARLVCLALVDNVRGQVSRFGIGDVKAALVTMRITAIEGDRIELVIEGTTRAVNPGQKPSGDRWDAASPEKQERGVQTSVLGEAVYDAEAERFERFDMVALGTRWGGTRYNAREHDMGEAGIGFAFTLDMDSPPVAPAFIWTYDW
jgi:hypothetical protein